MRTQQRARRQIKRVHAFARRMILWDVHRLKRVELSLNFRSHDDREPARAEKRSYVVERLSQWMQAAVARRDGAERDVIAALERAGQGCVLESSQRRAQRVFDRRLRLV